VVDVACLSPEEHAMTQGFSKRKDVGPVLFDPCQHLERIAPFPVPYPHGERWWLDLSRWRPPASHEAEMQTVPPAADAELVAASVALSTQWRAAMLGFHRFG
jgi:hypothetical protein